MICGLPSVTGSLRLWLSSAGSHILNLFFKGKMSFKERLEAHEGSHMGFPDCFNNAVDFLLLSLSLSLILAASKTGQKGSLLWC